MNNEPILDVNRLQTYFYMDDDQVARAVDDISFSVLPGETVAIVGESGSGKSMTALSIMQLINKPGEIVNGTVYLNDQSLTKRSYKQMSKIRGNDMAMIFQEPMTALNPVFTIGNQMIEVIRKHKNLTKKTAKEHAISLLNMVGIPRAEEIIHEYPHQLSGGMRQRVMIAIAISCDPQLLIADEPTTALDVTIQAQILNVINEMREKFNTALLLITHDLGVVSEYADRVLVMYCGQVVEQARTKKLLNQTKHPYTEGLLASIPDMNQDAERLGTIQGTVPPAHAFPKGCRFSTRCPYVMDKCKESNPELMEVEPNHFVRCFLYGDKGSEE